MLDSTLISAILRRTIAVYGTGFAVLMGGVTIAAAQSGDYVRPPMRVLPRVEAPLVQKVVEPAKVALKDEGTASTAPTGIVKTKPVLVPPTQGKASANANLGPASAPKEGQTEPTTLKQISGPLQPTSVVKVRAPARTANIPRMRWQHMQGSRLWTRAALSALKDHGSPLVDMVPRDIANWCPAYSTNNDAKRRAFWVGYMSALSKHESTYKPWAVGGGGKWYGLLQILPATARGYKCNVGTGEALKNGAANLSCGVRIMAHTVKRDGVIHGRDKKWRGVSADWGPMRNASKRRDMAEWLKRQNYCVLTSTTRPRARP